MRARRRTALSLLAGLCQIVWLAPPASAQDLTTAEAVDVNLVNLDVWVTDGRGATVRDLARGDFRVFEDGEEMKLSHFAFVPGGPPRPPAAATPGLPAAAPEPAPPGRSIAVFLDEAHTGVGRRNEALARLADGLEASFGPRDRVSVLRFRPSQPSPAVRAARRWCSDRTGGRFLAQVGADGAQAVALTSCLDDV